MKRDHALHIMSHHAAYSKLLADYDPAIFKATTMRHAADLVDPAGAATAGEMVVAEIARCAGDIDTYLSAVGHLLSARVKRFLAQNSAALNDLLTEHDALNYNYDFFSASTLARSYLLRPEYDEMPAESPNQMWLRVAIHLYADEPDALNRVRETFLSLGNQRYTHATPTLFNAGTLKAQGSSCFLITVGDSLESILQNALHDTGHISKRTGGIGLGLGKLRMSSIAGAGLSSGVLPVCRVIEKLTKYVDQGRKRNGAATVFLPIWHKDIYDFIRSTDNFGQSQALRLQHLNTSVWTNRLFFERASAGEKWTTFCPAKSGLFGKYGLEFEEAYLAAEAAIAPAEALYAAAAKEYADVRAEQMRTPGNRELQTRASELLAKKRAAARARIDHVVYDAAELLTLIADMEIKSGFPYVMSGDEVNAKSNQANIGAVNSSNLCQEITEVSTEDTIASCNLASISVKSFVRKPVSSPVLNAVRDSVGLPANETKERITAALHSTGAFDFAALGAATREVVRNIDMVIEHNLYPVEEKTRRLNMETRPLGIGVSGVDDAHKLLDIAYDSPIAEALNSAIFACMYYNALVASRDLAKRYGEYTHFRTGSFSIYRAASEPATNTQPPVSTDAVSECVVKDTFCGSPLANGIFQFDMWRMRAGELAARGKLNQSVYNRDDDIPLTPESWGETTGGWRDLAATIQEHGVRNSLLLAQMPTASTAQIFGNSEATEVHSSNIYSRTVASGNFVVSNRHLISDLSAIGAWGKQTHQFLVGFGGSVRHLAGFLKTHVLPGDKWTPDVAARVDHLVEKYKTMFEISQKVVMRYSRQRAVYIDQSQSLNIFVHDPSITQVKAILQYGNMLGLKTIIYYLREMNAVSTGEFTISPEMLQYRESVLNSSQTEKNVPSTSPSGPACSLADRDAGCLSCGA